MRPTVQFSSEFPAMVMKRKKVGILTKKMDPHVKCDSTHTLSSSQSHRTKGFTNHGKQSMFTALLMMSVGGGQERKNFVFTDKEFLEILEKLLSSLPLIPSLPDSSQLKHSLLTH